MESSTRKIVLMTLLAGQQWERDIENRLMDMGRGRRGFDAWKE